MKRVLIVVAMVASLVLAACGDSTPTPPNQQQQVEAKAKQFRAYLPRNYTELSNYNRAQKVYDDPSNILWCTFSFNNASSPLVTVPVTGKLTSSTTTFFNPEKAAWPDYESSYTLPSRSVDGLFHPSPPAYRYGFTPGGAYVDLFNLETYCSNKPTKFQRQSTKLSVELDAGLGRADSAAQAALRRGDKAEAQRIIEQAIGVTK